MDRFDMFFNRLKNALYEQYTTSADKIQKIRELVIAYSEEENNETGTDVSEHPAA